MADEVDVVVLGLGVGGEEVAGRLAESGLEVVGVEDRLVGGECPYWACIPSKMAVRAANLLAEAQRGDDVSGRTKATADWAPTASRIRREATSDWDDTAAADRFSAKGGRLVRGRGRLDGAGKVVAGDQEFRARRAVVVACGTVPATPPIEGLAGTPYWTNRELFEATRLPDSMLVLGGGAVGVETAQTLQRFGVDVVLVEAGDRLLPGEEPESGEMLAEVLQREGVEVLLQRRALRVRHEDGFVVDFDDGATRRAQQLLVSVGRRAQLSELGLETIGMDSATGWLSVDNRMRAGQRLWAVGDVTGRGAFTHVAMYQAGIAVSDILGQDGPVAQYHAVPRVTFTDPEIAAVGLSEVQAAREGIQVAVGRSWTPKTTRGWIHGAGNDGFVKLVVDSQQDVLVGATSAGPCGGEVLSMLTLAVHARVPLDSLRQMIYAFPTFHRGVLDALRDL